MNPLLQILAGKLPSRAFSLVALRRPGFPVVIRCLRPGDSRFIRREDLEPADFDGSVRSCEFTCDEILTVDLRWKNLEQLEGWIEEVAWAQGAWDMLRLSKPRDQDPEMWRQRPGNGLGVTFGGIGAVYSIPGSTGEVAPDNFELADIAAREGWWSWEWKPTAGWPADSIAFRAARKGDASISLAGTRPLPFPGWKAGQQFAGRSGEWWLGLMKSFEVSSDPGVALRCIWDFRTLTLNPRA